MMDRTRSLYRTSKAGPPIQHERDGRGRRMSGLVAAAFATMILTAWAGTSGADAEDRNGAGSDRVRCSNGWLTFAVRRLSQAEHDRLQGSVANLPVATVHTIRKTAVRNLVFYPDAGSGEILFRLDTGEPQKKAIHAALVTEEVYLAARDCLHEQWGGE